VRDKRYWENKRQNVHRKEKELEETLEKYRAEAEELRRKRKEILREAREESERLIKEANAKIENTIRAIVEAKAEKERTKQARKELSDFKGEIEELARKQQEERIDREMAKIIARNERKKNKKKEGANAAATVEPKKEAPVFTVGSYVRIRGQQSAGEILSIGKKDAQIRFGAIKTTVKLERLEPCEAPKEERRAVSFLTSETQEQLHNKRLNFKSEIDMRGMRGEEAMQALAYFIDDATICGVRQVRILHGTGNGILRTLLRQQLSTMPAVESFRDEHVQFGGAGITIVDLR
jgi:DNA mismatch repair protein MutS2